MKRADDRGWTRRQPIDSEDTVQDLDRSTALVADPATGLTPTDLRRAALSVCSYATDAEDARALLETLGLLDDLRNPATLAS